MKRGTTSGPRLELVVGGLTLSTALVLIGAVVSSLRTTERALEAVDRGAAAALIARVQDRLRDLGRPPEARDLEGMLAALEDEGLRYVALAPPGGIHEGVEAGEARLKDGDRPDALVRGAGVARLSVRLPPPPGRGPGPRGGPPGAKGRPPRPPFQPGGGPAADQPGFQPGDPGPGGGGPMITVELSSALSEGLLSDARRAVWIGGLAGALLLLAGPIVIYLLRQQRRMEQERLQQAELAALGRMSAVVAHEIKNPLASLKGHAQLLAERLEEPKALKKATRVIDEAQRLETLVRGLLEFLRSRRVSPKATELSPLVRAAIEEAAGTGRVEADLAAAPASWALDADRMRQVLVNLLGNALEATSEGPVQLEVGEHAGDLRLQICDRGEGLPAGQDVFAPFVTTKTHGTGLGLSVARAIVEAHGGALSAAPRSGGGTVMTATLPATPPPSVP